LTWYFIVLLPWYHVILFIILLLYLFSCELKTKSLDKFSTEFGFNLTAANKFTQWTGKINMWWSCQKYLQPISFWIIRIRRPFSDYQRLNTVIVILIIYHILKTTNMKYLFPWILVCRYEPRIYIRLYICIQIFRKIHHRY